MLDTRPPPSFEFDHIPKSINLPFHNVYDKNMLGELKFKGR